ncbi:iron-containing alcohol dehydrogenase [Candidatus Lokiarchaeum ossiferum]|uniref:iron-containing alcohol dehydrogenase n=1 Tax=Candidatus Lokiarchaeum ossiferum TaxID=2951803 RepID=UPI00352EE1F6
MPTFVSPKTVYFGEDALDQFESIKGQKCFIVTDKILVKLGIVKILTDKLQEFEKSWEIFDGVEPDPHEDTILKAKELCAKFEPDLIIGLGGGSSLDAAKAVWFLYEHDDFGIDDLNPFEDLHMGIKAKCVAIPTTSGTGAEATWAVIVTRTDEDGLQSKLEQAHFDVLPTYAIVDPIFTTNLPQSLTVATGFDALAHSCEGLVSEWKNDLADGMCLHAISLVKQYLPMVVEDGKNQLAREKMANAATIAGLGFGNSQVTIGHSLGHSLGAVFHITHGISVGVVLPYILQFYLNNSDDDSATIILGLAAKKTGIAQWDDDNKQAAHKLIEYIVSLQKQLNFPSKLSECGITREQLDSQMGRLVDLTNESASITMSPRDASDDEIQKLLEYVFEGTMIDF